MFTLKPGERRWQSLLGTSLFETTRLHATERRDQAARYALLRRIYRGFKQTPGLSLTPGEAARVFELPLDAASRILERLVATRVLRQRHDGQFTYRIEDES